MRVQMFRSSAPPVVLQVLPSLNTGGVERGTVEIAQAVAEANGTAIVASAGGRMVPLAEAAGGLHITLPLTTKNPLGIWRNAHRLETLIRQHRVSIVHGRSRAPAWSAWLACQRTGVPFVTTYHGTYSENLPFKRNYNAIMARGEIVIAASHYIARLVADRHQVNPAHIRVIPRGVDPSEFDPDAISSDRTARVAQDWHLPAGAHTVVLPGRLSEWKGHAILLDAIARLRRQDVLCVLVGSHQGRHHYVRKLQRQAARLGIADRIRFAGQCDDMPAALQLSDVVVHASTQPEAFGRVVVEAQAMRRPVIAADLGGPVETVRHGVTGWRVAPGDPDALAGAITHALDLEPAAREAIGQRARAAVPTVRAMQRATLDVYESILHAHQAQFVT
jgi:glycosyltransferase involved in cell wall biosynthesis